MTSREDIERLLNQTGRTLKVLPNSYSMQEVDSRFKEIAGRWRFGDLVLHQSDVIELLIGALKDSEPVVHAKWEEVESNVIRCSACQEKWSIRDDGDFVIIEAKTDLKRCPTCGAKMDG